MITVVSDTSPINYLVLILDAADARGLPSLEDAEHKLRRSNFRISPAMIEALLERARLRKRD